MKIKDIVRALESFAPLPLQEDYDNAGLQTGLPEAEVSGALLCLDVTESVVEEAVEQGCGIVVSHHPVMFRPLRHLTDSSQPERIVRMALKNDVAIYSAHTNLDNARGGVNFEMACRLGLQDVDFLQRHTDESGSGVTGMLPEPEEAAAFLKRVKDMFGVECLMHNELLQRSIRKVALCGGAGDFLLKEAVAWGADAFLTGEMRYHVYFGQEQQIQIATLGHYESEQFTQHLLKSILEKALPELKVRITQQKTNPVYYLK
ncbi:MAG: Nif3-like dinuclear metal center hexameric protein [Bacteroidaceae bacterium]|nr:Nif3-like dinuclear metal center hexameric protein [Bacteroidaceae bacterium]